MTKQKPNDEATEATEPEGRGPGRPLMFKTVEALEKAIKKYLLDCRFPEETILDPGQSPWRKPPTMSGLARALNTNRQTLVEYANRDKYADSIKNAKAWIEEFNEEKLYDRNTPTAGVIFNLTNNYGWKNPQHVKLAGDADDRTPLSLSNLLDKASQ